MTLPCVQTPYAPVARASTSAQKEALHRVHKRDRRRGSAT